MALHIVECRGATRLSQGVVGVLFADWHGSEFPSWGTARVNLPFLFPLLFFKCHNGRLGALCVWGYKWVLFRVYTTCFTICCSLVFGLRLPG